MASPAIALDLAAAPTPVVTGNKTTERHWLIGSGNLAQSFWIAGALFVLPIAAMVYFVVTDLSAQIEFADKERLGAEYIVPLVHFQRAVIDYRTGIASPLAVDGASEATEADLAAVERAAQEVAAVDQRNGGTLRVADLWKIARRDWTRIKSGMRDATREKRLAATDTLLVRLRKSIQDVADSSNLTLDPEIHSYYLMDTVSQKVPQALQFLGDGRDAGIASGDSAALADMVRFRSAMTSAAVASDQIRNSIKRAVESYVPLDQTVGPAAKKAQDAIEGVVRFAETGIPDLAAVAAGPKASGTPFEIRDVPAWREATARAVEALAATADEGALALQRLLEARVTDLKATLWMRVVFTVGFCLVAVLMLRILSGNQVRVARERNEEAARIPPRTRVTRGRSCSSWTSSPRSRKATSPLGPRSRRRSPARSPTRSTPPSPSCMAW